MADTKKVPRSKHKLTPGQIVKSQAHAWKVVEKLGEGGFGDVYKVIDDSAKEYAMKTEYSDPKAKKSSDRLKIEWKVYNEIGKADEDKRAHFPAGIDKGQTNYNQQPNFKWLAMSLVGLSLEDLRRAYLEASGDGFGTTTAFKIALQTLRAIEQLHELGFLHRDIKPQNFTIGVPPNEATIFLLDFGIAKRFVDKDGKLRIPRQSVRFLGTVRWASRNCHNEKEQGRRDDLESWCFLVLEQFCADNITWRRVSDRNKVAMYKHQLMTRGGRDIKGPRDLYKVIAYIEALSYADAPDYEKIRGVLLDSARNAECDLSSKFDWEGVNLKRTVKKKTGAANRITDDSEETEPLMKDKKEKRRNRFSLVNDSTSDSPPPAKPPTARKSYSKINAMPRHVTPSLKGRVRTSANNPNSRIQTLTARPMSTMRGVPTTAVGGGADVVASPVTTTVTGTTGGSTINSAYKVMTAIPRTPGPAPRLENSIGGLPRDKKKPQGGLAPPQLPPP